MPSKPPDRSLRERKQRRTRDAIVNAAYELFADRGFDAVTVSEIATRAEVGRTTFFRYFGDKQEVLFAEDPDVLAALADHIRHAATAAGPIGDVLPAAVALVRDAGAAAFASGPARRPQRTAVLIDLLEQHPELNGRHLLKQERQATVLRDVLAACGASPAVAALAPQLALACLRAAAQVAGDDPRALPAALDDAFARVIAASG